MQTVQRKFGKYLTRSADESQVSMLLKDFEEADKMLTRIIDASKAWRDSWTSILGVQHRLVGEFEGLYAPIIGAGDSYSGHVPVETAQSTMERTARLQREYEELKRDLLDEVNLVDARLVKPAMEAKDYMQPIKKTIKKREDKKLDFGRYQSRVDSGRKKLKRSDRENEALAKSESDLTRAKEEYNAADEHLRAWLPRLITAVFSLLPHLLSAQIITQNNLLAQYYTMLHTYCGEENFPSPAPPMQEVVAVWERDFKPVQEEVETNINTIAHGKAVRQSMNLEDQRRGSHSNGFGPRRPSGQSALRKPSISPGRSLPPSNARIPSLPSPSSSVVLSPSAAESAVVSPAPSTTSDYQTPMAYAPAGPNVDYFSRDRQPSSSSLNSSISLAIAGKKKPPPPPPRIPSSQGIWVTALYDFAGQSSGDLVFKEGDKIRVIKKTESTDDWWTGELRGTQGPFPANYCQGA